MNEKKNDLEKVGLFGKVKIIEEKEYYTTEEFKKVISLRNHSFFEYNRYGYIKKYLAWSYFLNNVSDKDKKIYCLKIDGDNFKGNKWDIKDIYLGDPIKQIPVEGAEFYEYDENNNLIKRSNQYLNNCVFYQYNSKGDMICRYSIICSSCSKKNWAYKYDINGNVIVDWCLDINGDIIEKTVYKYDLNTNKITFFCYFNYRNKYISYYNETYKYDLNGNLIEILRNGKYGYIKKYRYDTKGNKREYEYNLKKEFIRKTVYNSKGQKVEVYIKNNEGKLHLRKKINYDLLGNITEYIEYDSNNIIKQLSYIYEYDNNNNWTTQICLSKDKSKFKIYVRIRKIIYEKSNYFY